MEDDNAEEVSTPGSPKEGITPDVLRHNLKKAVKRNEKLQQKCDALTNNFNILQEDYNKKKEIISQLLKEKEILTEKNTELVGRLENKDSQIEQITNLFNEKDEECEKLIKEIELIKKRSSNNHENEENTQNLLASIKQLKEQLERAHHNNEVMSNDQSALLDEMDKLRDENDELIRKLNRQNQIRTSLKIQLTTKQHPMLKKQRIIIVLMILITFFLCLMIIITVEITIKIQKPIINKQAIQVIY